MAAVNPITDPGAWDWVTIGGKPVPGIPTVDGAGAPLGWDKRKGYGTSGATTVFTGADVPEFTLHLQMWDPEHLDYFNDEIVPVLLEAMSGKTAVDFYAPACSEPPLDIKSVVVVDPGQLTQDGDGFWNAAIKLMKYVKPRPGVGKPASSKKAGQQPSAQDAQDKEIAALTQQLKDLANDQ